MRAAPSILAAGLALTACASAPTAREAELSTLRFGFAVPKSPASRLVRTFERHCLDLIATPDAIGLSLEAADYVAIRVAPLHGRQSWVVDDTRPAVTVTRRDRQTTCGVTAIARTGQSARVERMVAARFPEARPRSGRPFEAAWSVAPGLDIVTTRRRDRDGRPVYRVMAVQYGGTA